MVEHTNHSLLVTPFYKVYFGCGCKVMFKNFHTSNFMICASVIS